MFTSIIAMLEELGTLAPEIIAGIKAAASNPAVVDLENLILPHLTTTKTDGANGGSVLVEPSPKAAA